MSKSLQKKRWQLDISSGLYCTTEFLLWEVVVSCHNRGFKMAISREHTGDECLPKCATKGNIHLCHRHILISLCFYITQNVIRRFTLSNAFEGVGVVCGLGGICVLGGCRLVCEVYHRKWHLTLTSWFNKNIYSYKIWVKSIAQDIRLKY